MCGGEGASPPAAAATARRAAKPDVPAAASRVSAAVMFSYVNKCNSFRHLKTNGRHRQLRMAAPPPGPDAEGPRRVEAVCSVTQENRAVTTDPSCCGSHRKERCLTRARTKRPPERFFKTNKKKTTINQKPAPEPSASRARRLVPGALSARGGHGALGCGGRRAGGAGSHGPGTWWGRLLSWGPKPAPHQPGPSQDESSRVLRGSPEPLSHHRPQGPGAPSVAAQLGGSLGFPGMGCLCRLAQRGPPLPWASK